MPTSEEMKASKQAQVKESMDRGGRAPEAAELRQANQDALDVVDDSTGPVDDAPPQRQQAREAVDDHLPEAKPIRRGTEYDQRRADIIKGFRTHRAEEVEDDTNTDDIRRITRDGMPPELVPLEAADDNPAPEPVEDVSADDTVLEEDAAPVAPTKRKLKVRGKELEVSDEELVALAQKGAAGDDYLEEARKKLDEVNALTREIRTRVDGTPATQHQRSATPQSDADPQPETNVDPHQSDAFYQTAETVQLGTPEEAALSLRKTVTEAANVAAREQLEKERIRDEAARSSKYLKTFQEENAELANDSLAHAVIERKLYDLQREDIRALGIDEAQIPRTPVDTANWHMWYRANGYKVRNIPELLTTARDAVYEWRGKAKPSADPTTPTQPAARTGAPRVEVTVNREQRRAAIPQQPSRTNAPRPVSQQAPAAPQDRSSVVQKMIEARAKPRGKVMGT